MSISGELQFVLIWAFGALLQLFLLIRKDINLKNLLLSGFVSLSLMFPDWKDETYILVKHIIIVVLFFIMLIGFLHKKHLLPRVNELSILLLTIIFWYSVFSFDYQSEIAYICKSLAIIPTLITFYSVMQKGKLAKILRMTLYVWHMIIIMTLAFINYEFLSFNNFYVDASRDILPNVLDIFAHGMVSTYLFLYGLYLSRLIPIPGKRQSIKDRGKEWREDVKLMLSKYSNEDINIKYAFLVIIVLGGLLTINYFFNIISNFFAINLGILLVEVLGSRLNFVKVRK